MSITGRAARAVNRLRARRPAGLRVPADLREGGRRRLGRRAQGPGRANGARAPGPDGGRGAGRRHGRDGDRDREHHLDERECATQWSLPRMNHPQTPLEKRKRTGTEQRHRRTTRSCYS